MKKYIILAISTIAFVSIFTISGQLIKNDVNYVSIQEIKPTKVEDIVVSSGNIEYKTNKKLYSSYFGKVQNIVVSNGDEVNKGDLICEVLVTSDVSVNNFDESLLANETLSEFENYSTQEIYQQILNGNYDILDDYDKFLASDDYNQNVSPVTNQDKIDEVVKIYADASGTVSDLNYSNGEYIDLSKEIYTTISSDEFNVKLQIGEDKISKIEIGQPVEITSVVFEDDVFTGVISKINNEAEQKTTTTGKNTTVEVTVSIDSNNENLKNGYSAKCSIITSSKDNVYLIPYDIINVNENGEEFVYVYENGIATSKVIDTSKEYPQGVEVNKSFYSDNYIINTSVNLSDGEFVKITTESQVD